MAVLYATGWEAGSIAWYNAQTPAAWTGSSNINTFGTGLHRNAAGTGGNYSVWVAPNWRCAAGTVTAGSARWLHFWWRPYVNFQSLCVQFGRSGTLQCQVWFGSDGRVYLLRGTTQLTFTGSGQYIPRLGHWIAIELTCQDAGGIINAYVDDVLVASFTGDTKEHASLTDWDHWGWGNLFGGGFNQDAWIDDVVVTDSTTGKVTEKYLMPIAPDGDSSPLTLTPSTGVTHYNLVDEIPLNDTDFNSTAVSGNEDLYTFTAPPTANSILAVVFSARATNDAGLTLGAISVKSGATTVYQPAVTLAVSPTYTDTSYILDTDPDTAVAWTNAGVAAVEAGYRFNT